MKRFQCPDCGNELYFDNTACVGCGKPVGYLPHAAAMITLATDASGISTARHGDTIYQPCSNAPYDACNWLVPQSDIEHRCVSCRHDRTIPDLALPSNLAAWRAIELAKRQLFYSLIQWHLPVPMRAGNSVNGLAFDILAEIAGPDGNVQRVLTGHDSGLITLNLAEADDANREKMRTAMHEPYRTLLGHFRHEIGHYYWDVLVNNAGGLDAFRAIFGDERADYAAALKRNYDEGPASDWAQNYISSYASVHPWEDFAETWAHYVHIIDSLETARAFGMIIEGSPGSGDTKSVSFNPYGATSIKAILDMWVPLTLALNTINRSMGQKDFYPFVIGPLVVRKLEFIHGLIHKVSAEDLKPGQGSKPRQDSRAKAQTHWFRRMLAR